MNQLTTDFNSNEIKYAKLSEKIEVLLSAKDNVQNSEQLKSILTKQGLGLVRQNIFHGILTHVLPSIQDENKEKLEIQRRNIVHNLFKDLIGTLEIGYELYRTAIMDATSSYVLYNKLLEQFAICDTHKETYISFVFKELLTFKGGLQSIPLAVYDLIEILKSKHRFIKRIRKGSNT